MSMASKALRNIFEKDDEERDRGLTTPEDIRRSESIAYGTDEQWQVLDVYRPKEAKREKLPVIVSVHGGGWVYGDKERYQFYCMNLAERGFAVVNFTYRLAPEFKFPCQLEDTNKVFGWVLGHAEVYGFDTDHIFAVGDSAGAHILGLFCNLCTNPKYAEKFTFTPPEGFVPKAVALNCGVYSIPYDNTLEIEGSMQSMTLQLLKDLLPKKGKDKAEVDAISVINYITPQFPPTFIMTSNGDFARPQAPILDQKLTVYDVPHVLRAYEGGDGSALGHVFHLNIRSAAAKTCNDDECAFFREYL